MFYLFPKIVNIYRVYYIWKGIEVSISIFGLIILKAVDYVNIILN